MQPPGHRGAENGPTSKLQSILLLCVFLDVSATFELGLQAIFAHVGQIADRVAVEKRMRERTAEIGKPVGLPLANAFLSIVID